MAAISSLILTFLQEGDTTTLTLRIVLLVFEILVLWLLASSKWVDRQLSRMVDSLLKNDSH